MRYVWLGFVGFLSVGWVIGCGSGNGQSDKNKEIRIIDNSKADEVVIHPGMGLIQVDTPSEVNLPDIGTDQTYVPYPCDKSLNFENNTFHVFYENCEYLMAVPLGSGIEVPKGNYMVVVNSTKIDVKVEDGSRIALPVLRYELTAPEVVQITLSHGAVFPAQKGINGLCNSDNGLVDHAVYSYWEYEHQVYGYAEKTKTESFSQAASLAACQQSTTQRIDLLDQFTSIRFVFNAPTNKNIDSGTSYVYPANAGDHKYSTTMPYDGSVHAFVTLPNYTFPYYEVSIRLPVFRTSPIEQKLWISKTLANSWSTRNNRLDYVINNTSSFTTLDTTDKVVHVGRIEVNLPLGAWSLFVNNGSLLNDQYFPGGNGIDVLPGTYTVKVAQSGGVDLTRQIVIEDIENNLVKINFANPTVTVIAPSAGTYPDWLPDKQINYSCGSSPCHYRTDGFYYSDSSYKTTFSPFGDPISLPPGEYLFYVNGSWTYLTPTYGDDWTIYVGRLSFDDTVAESYQIKQGVEELLGYAKIPAETSIMLLPGTYEARVNYKNGMHGFETVTLENKP